MPDMTPKQISEAVAEVKLYTDAATTMVFRGPVQIVLTALEEARRERDALQEENDSAFKGLLGASRGECVEWGRNEMRQRAEAAEQRVKELERYAPKGGADWGDTLRLGDLCNKLIAAKDKDSFCGVFDSELLTRHSGIENLDPKLLRDFRGLLWELQQRIENAVRLVKEVTPLSDDWRIKEIIAILKGESDG